MHVNPVFVPDYKNRLYKSIFDQGENMMIKTYTLLLASIAIFINVFLLPISYAGWFGGNDTKWSKADKNNFCHFLNSQRADIQATRISNSTSTRYATEQQASKILTLWRQALQEARLVSDFVLDKTHPKFKNMYRNNYQKALQYQIQAFEQKNVSYSVTGAEIKSNFTNWFNSAKEKFRIPKGTVKACQ